MMNCMKCGKGIPIDSKYCPYCGSPVSAKQPGALNETAELVKRAKDGDQAAVSALYEQTYNQVFYTVKSMIKDEDAVFDILQDSYIKAFSHLDSFEGGEKFTACAVVPDPLKKSKIIESASLPITIAFLIKPTGLGKSKTFLLSNKFLMSRVAFLFPSTSVHRLSFRLVWLFSQKFPRFSSQFLKSAHF